MDRSAGPAARSPAARARVHPAPPPHRDSDRPDRTRGSGRSRPQDRGTPPNSPSGSEAAAHRRSAGSPRRSTGPRSRSARAAAISKRSTPSATRPRAARRSALLARSGLIAESEPAASGCMVRRSASVASADPSASTSAAMPKSTTASEASGRTSTFELLTSRCTTPWACDAASASAKTLAEFDRETLAAARIAAAVVIRAAIVDMLKHRHAVDELGHEIRAVLLPRDRGRCRRE